MILPMCSAGSHAPRLSKCRTAPIRESSIVRTFDLGTGTLWSEYAAFDILHRTCFAFRETPAKKFAEPGKILGHRISLRR